MREAYFLLVVVAVFAGVGLLNDFKVSGLMATPISSGSWGYGTPTISGSQWQRGGGGAPSTAIPESMGSQGPVGMIPEICTDGVDNDLDRKVDCKDPECKKDLACIGGCRLSARVVKLSGQKACVDGERVVCSKTGAGWGFVPLPCPSGKRCFGGSCV